MRINKELAEILYQKEFKECVQDCEIRCFLRNGYCPNCDGQNLKKNQKILEFKYKIYL